MGLIKKIFILSVFVSLTNCTAPGAALLGPSITVANTGNIYQAGLSYGSSHLIKEAKKTLEQMNEAKKNLYEQLSQTHHEQLIQIHQKFRKDKINQAFLKNQSDFFFKTIKNNFKKSN
tara:strand:+ start:274 stop:627 length:354 start_codon:yes stop_codon:yes gene_type:complete